MTKRKKALPPRRKRMRRPARLASARTWLPRYGGNHVVKGYSRWYGVDLLCAVTELRLLGVSVSAEYEAQLRLDVVRRAERHRQAKLRRLARTAVEPADDFPWWLDLDEESIPF